MCKLKLSVLVDAGFNHRRKRLRRGTPLSRLLIVPVPTVPSAREVLANLRIDRTRAEKLLRILLKENLLHKVTEDLIFHQSAIHKLRQILADRKARDNRLSVTDFKALTGLSRKYAIPLLEYLDRERVTRRDGDDRIIL